MTSTDPGAVRPPDAASPAGDASSSPPFVNELLHSEVTSPPLRILVLADRFQMGVTALLARLKLSIATIKVCAHPPVAPV